MTQSVEITTKYGIITISHESDEPLNTKRCIDNIKLVNVSSGSSQKAPIIYDKTNEFADICLLEEIKYLISFETTCNNLNVFKTLQNFQDNSPLDIYEIEGNYKGSLQFSSYVGKTFLDIYEDDECVFSYPIEVRSRKLDYNRHYSRMIGDLSKYSSGIVFELSSPTFQEFILESSNQSPYERFMILEYIMREEHLPSIIEYLSRNLYSTLENIKQEVPTSFAANISPDDLIDAMLDCEEFYANIPLRVNETKYEDTIDVVENRFYKYFLELIDALIDDLIIKIPDGYPYDKLKAYKSEVNYYLSQRYFEEISPLNHVPLNSQVLQKKEGYRDILSYYLMFEFGLKLKWNDLSDDLKGHEKKVYDLYEDWCYFELINILKSMCDDCDVKFEDIFKTSDDGVSIELKKGVKKVFNLDGMTIDLLYNKTFNRFGENYKTYSVELRPDYTLAVHINDETHYIHFDAKYKMDVNSERFKNEDIVKMHAYKDAIHNTIGAYIIYPGRDDRLFWQDDDELQSVGAFGLIPGNENSNNIKEFIETTLNKIK